jgi:hypothetical protein
LARFCLFSARVFARVAIHSFFRSSLNPSRAKSFVAELAFGPFCGSKLFFELLSNL